MVERKLQHERVEPGRDPNGGPPEARKAWHEPKLTFVEPKLTLHGELTEVTGQFFGAFTPSPRD
jgi:hypothetical protein